MGPCTVHYNLLSIPKLIVSGYLPFSSPNPLLQLITEIDYSLAPKVAHTSVFATDSFIISVFRS